MTRLSSFPARRARATARAAAVLCVSIAVPAHGASKPAFWDGWQGEVAVSIAPRVGRSPAHGGDETFVDESKGEINVSALRPNGVAGIPLRLRIGITDSPGLLADGAAESAAYGEITVGDAYIVRHGPQRDARPSAAAGAWRPYARYRLTRVYAGFLDGRLRDEHLATAGLRYRHVLSMVPALRPGGGSVRGWYGEARGEVSELRSNDSRRERLYTNLRADLYSRPLGGWFRLFGRAQETASFFRSERAPDGRRRRDHRLRLAAGVDLSEWAAGAGDVILELAAQYQRRWSTDRRAEHERAYLVPSFTLRTAF